jgi:chemotaxis protein methyltransferase CheR
VTPQDRDLIARLCAERAGLKVDPEKVYLLENRLAPVARREGFASVHDLTVAIRDRDDDRLAWAAVEAMSPTETAFFREPLPDLAYRIARDPAPLASQGAPMGGAGREGGTLRLWAAACGAGQEVYSLAMALEERAPAGVTIEVFASDLCERRLEKAQVGVYSQFEVQRGLSARRLVRHFEGLDEGFVLSPRVRQMVRWRRVNLMEDLSRFGQFDIVLCRNLMGHLLEDARARVLGNLERTLKPGGWLVLGAGETAPGLSPIADRPGFHGRPAAARAA